MVTVRNTINPIVDTIFFQNILLSYDFNVIKNVLAHKIKLRPKAIIVNFLLSFLSVVINEVFNS